MNWTKKYLASAFLAISVYFPKSYLQTSPHHQSHTYSKVLVSTSKFLKKNFQKYNIFMDNLECKKSPKTVADVAYPGTELDFAFQTMCVTESDKYVNNVEINLNDRCKETIKQTYTYEKNRFKEIRKWKQMNTDFNHDDSFVFKLISFNILAQDLLEWHQYLYRNHDKQVLNWEKRQPLLIQEILQSKAHIICLQEMQESHLRDFLKPFQESGFNYTYKKRTNNKTDGLLLMYKKNMFNLLELSKVELHQSGIELLNRDNVGLIAKFSLMENPGIKFVIATTHLLYNPRRHDVRLGQMQLLFAEIERMSFIENSPSGPKYLPIVLSGDFNLTPYSGVYKFVTEGSIEFVGKGRNLETNDYRFLSNSLIPPHLYITDECQHFNVLSKRLSGHGQGKVMLMNTENVDTTNIEDLSLNLFDSKSTTYQKVEVANGHYVTFSSGLLTHPFQFKSVYDHLDNKGNTEATTFQDQWITVDYIFYSDLKPLEKYLLPTDKECKKFFPTIPNSIIGSDHFCLGATFQLKKK